MDLLIKLKSRIGDRLLSKENNQTRDKRGSNFEHANSVGLVFKCGDKSSFDRVKDYQTFLKGEHGIREVKVLAYIDENQKNTPIWLKKAATIDFFSKKEVNWTLRPGKEVDNFCSSDFDILIDLSSEKCIPLSFVVARSKAKMKVSRLSNPHSQFCDLLVDIDQSKSTEIYIQEVNNLLSNFNLK